MTSEGLNLIISRIQVYIDLILEEEKTGIRHTSHDTIIQNILMEIENIVPMNMAMIEDELVFIRQHIFATHQIMKENNLFGSIEQYVTVTPMPNNTSVIETATTPIVRYSGGIRITFLKNAQDTHDVFVTVDTNGYIKTQRCIKEELAALDRREKEETKKNTEGEDAYKEKIRSIYADLVRLVNFYVILIEKQNKDPQYLTDNEVELLKESTNIILPLKAKCDMDSFTFTRTTFEINGHIMAANAIIRNQNLPISLSNAVRTDTLFIERSDKLGNPYVGGLIVYFLEDTIWSKKIVIEVDQNGVLVCPTLTPQDIREIQINDRLTDKAIKEANEAKEAFAKEEKVDVSDEVDPFEYMNTPDDEMKKVAELVVESIKEHQITKTVQSLNRISEIISEMSEHGYNGNNVNRVIEYAVDTLHFNQIKSTVYNTFEVDASIFEPETKVKPGIYIAPFQKYEPRNRIELRLDANGILYIHSK